MEKVCYENGSNGNLIMENLEEQCLERLNNILSKFDLQVVKHDVESQIKYVLVDISNNPYSGDIHVNNDMSEWSSINTMLCSSRSIFYIFSQHAENATYFGLIGFNAPRKIREKYQRYINAYNNIKYLENASSLEELMIKMDLMGI
jgi:hypothetical protein